MTGIFLQARIDSSRLPAKALLSLGERTLIEHAMVRLRRVSADVYVLLTDEASLPFLAPYARARGFEVFAGPRDDVLMRYVMAARAYGVRTVVRATGDNPLVSAVAASAALALHGREGSDYTGFRDIPLGTGVEVVKASALFRAAEETADPYDREHVTPYVRRGEGGLVVHLVDPPLSWRAPELRVTVDTLEDFLFVCRIMSEDPDVEIEDLVARWGGKARDAVVEGVRRWG